MITGIFLRYIKTYRGYNYIPLLSDDRFCGLVGDNGIGKSSILEALDALFNDKSLNLNVTTKRSGFVETNPHVVPVFLIKRSELASSAIQPLAEALSTVALSINETDVGSPVLKSQVRKFAAHRATLTSAFSMDGYSYRTRTDRQQNLKKQDVYNLIIQAFFNIRMLHRKQGEPPG